MFEEAGEAFLVAHDAGLGVDGDDLVVAGVDPDAQSALFVEDRFECGEEDEVGDVRPASASSFGEAFHGGVVVAGVEEEFGGWFSFLFCVADDEGVVCDVGGDAFEFCVGDDEMEHNLSPRRCWLGEDIGEFIVGGRVFDFLGDASSGGEIVLDEFAVRGSVDVGVGAGDDAGGDLEDFELQVFGDDGFEAEGAEDAAEELEAFFDDGFSHLEDFGEEAFAHDDGDVAGDDEGGVDAEFFEFVDAADALEFVDGGFVAAVHAEELEAAFVEFVSGVLDR